MLLQRKYPVKIDKLMTAINAYIKNSEFDKFTGANNLIYFQGYSINISGRSAVGSAPRSGRGGRWFESSRPDQSKSNWIIHKTCFEF